MSFRPDHDLHKRRWSRNLGLGLVLLVFVALVYGLTLVKTLENGRNAQPVVEGNK